MGGMRDESESQTKGSSGMTLLRTFHRLEGKGTSLKGFQQGSHKKVSLLSGYMERDGLRIASLFLYIILLK